MARITKQLVYGGIYLVIFCLLGSWIYFAFLRPAPGCTNGRRDSNEEGVDCGPVCGNVCLPSDLKPLQISGEVKIFHPKNNQLALLAIVQNPNPDFAAREFQYRLDFVSDSGGALGSQMGRSFIYGSEVKPLAAFIERTDAASIARAELTIFGAKWAKAADFRKLDAAILDRAGNTSDGQVRLTGKLANRDSLAAPLVTVTAEFMSSGGSVLGVSETRLENLAPEESRSFTILYPAVAGIDVNRTQYFVSAQHP